MAGKGRTATRAARPPKRSSCPDATVGSGHATVRTPKPPDAPEQSQVDLVRRLASVHPDQTKAHQAIPVPLNGEAVGVTCRWLGRHSTRVSSYHGKPITQVSSKAWSAALARAGIVCLASTRTAGDVI